VIAGAALVPSAAAQPAPAPATRPAAASVLDDTGQLRLDRADAQRARDRVARVVEERAVELPELSGSSTQATTISPDPYRFSGANRYIVASRVADLYWGKYFWNEKESGPIDFAKVVFVASGAGFPDALSGGAAAGAFGGPMLLTKKDSIPTVTTRSLERLKPDAIVLLGGTATISTAVESKLRSYGNVSRIAGADRYAVSANVAGNIGWSDVAYVASGTNFPDGLAGGAVAGWEMSPLLLTRPTTVPGDVVNVLNNVVKPKRIYVLGGPASVSDAVITQLKKDVTTDVQRIDGANRYAVAERLARQHPTLNVATLANGGDWPDALSGSALAGVTGSKLLLVRPTKLPAETQRAILRHGLGYIDVLGGTASVSEAVLDQLRALRVTVPDA
jgi:putative cell wall-binding protein